MRAFRRLIALGGAAAACAMAPDALACTLATSSVDLGHATSYAAAGAPVSGSGSAGIRCDILLAALTTHYVGVQIDASTFRLTGPGGQTIAYTASLAPNGTALGVGSFQNLSSLSIVSLFAGADNSIPLYIRTTPTTALRAGTYTGTIDLRWYYSVCSLGAAVCLAYSASPGFVRPVPLVTPINWGTGTPVRVNVQLIVDADCVITAPTLDFGSAPLAASFNPVTRTIQIRCSAGSPYTVGLDNGSHASGTTRRMQSGPNFLAYEIYKTASATERWGGAGSERRSSASADSNAGIYDSVTTQGFTYRAVIEPGQATPSAGSYSDRIRVDIEF